jgi:hypothetical protein
LKPAKFHQFLHRWRRKSVTQEALEIIDPGLRQGNTTRLLSEEILSTVPHKKPSMSGTRPVQLLIG